MTDPQDMVIGCMAAAGAVAVGNSIVDGRPPAFRQLAGFAFTAIGLAALAVPAPKLAGGMAALILTSALFVYGEPLYKGINQTTK